MRYRDGPQNRHPGKLLELPPLSGMPEYHRCLRRGNWKDNCSGLPRRFRGVRTGKSGSNRGRPENRSGRYRRGYSGMSVLRGSHEKAPGTTGAVLGLQQLPEMPGHPEYLRFMIPGWFEIPGFSGKGIPTMPMPHLSWPAHDILSRTCLRKLPPALTPFPVGSFFHLRPDSSRVPERHRNIPMKQFL